MTNAAKVTGDKSRRERSSPQTKIPRRIGSETSKTRHAILDAVEKLLVEEGYASVTYRGVAAKATVLPAVVQYYFPLLDDIFVATIRRNVDHHIGRLTSALQERSHEPLRVIWEFSKEEVTSALAMEFTALANHRKSIQAEIADISARVREVQIEAIRSIPAPLRDANGEISPSVLLFLLTGIPKLLTIEANLGVFNNHNEVIQTFENYINRVEGKL